MALPIRVGVLNDLSDTSPGPGDISQWLRLATDELIASGRLDREVEFIHGAGLGLPSGTAAAVERAYAELASRDVLLIVGPAIGDNALVATPLADRHRVPTINWAGSERARSSYMFHLQVGSHEDESIVIARHLAARKIRRVAVVFDKSPIGRRYLHFLQGEAEILGLDIAATAGIQPLAENAAPVLEKMLRQPVDGLVYLGLGQSAAAVNRALIAAGWEGEKIMNTAGIRGHLPEFAREIEGWAYLDMYADNNSTLTAYCQRLGKPEARPAAARGYDMGRLVAEGLARAGELTRDGVREGLELTKWLPAAQGHEGTLLGFGNHDRGALHGRYLVVRQWRDARSIQAPDPLES